MHVNVGRTDVRLNDEALEEVDRFKYLWSQVYTGSEMDSIPE